jgi:hypothetical protein
MIVANGQTNAGGSTVFVSRNPSEVIKLQQWAAIWAGSWCSCDAQDYQAFHILRADACRAQNMVRAKWTSRQGGEKAKPAANRLAAGVKCAGLCRLQSAAVC